LLLLEKIQRIAEKAKEMLREPQHERKIISDINSHPFVLSTVEGLRERSRAIR
jgi:hypothetical protein